jgi:bifunctional UDP-N-acetylglucosamine pyrophosphorylase/glucosamine-1-phosphate N-acetyltransferase
METIFDVIILAGGKGTRMNSNLPKPLYEVGGIPTLRRIIVSTSALSPRPIIVVNDQAEKIIQIAGKNCRFVLQKEQKGTGHAVQCVKRSLKKSDVKENLMVLPGDHPMISTKTLNELSASHLGSNASLTLCTLVVPDLEEDRRLFFNYGRIRRDPSGELASIVEVKDATEKEKEIRELNVGYYCFKTTWLWKNIDALTDHNAAREFYLTDLVRVAIEQNVKTNSYALDDPSVGMGFNTPEQLEIIRKYGHK